MCHAQNQTHHSEYKSAEHFEETRSSLKITLMMKTETTGTDTQSPNINPAIISLVRKMGGAIKSKDSDSDFLAKLGAMSAEVKAVFAAVPVSENQSTARL